LHGEHEPRRQEDAMALAVSLADRQPLGEINTTPLIDVMLVLLIMFVISVPAATHSLEVPLPAGGEGRVQENNRLVLTAGDRVLWNEQEVSLSELTALLAAAARRPVEPELQFAPDGSASYGLSAEVLRMIKGSGLAAFGFVGNERFSEFGKPAKR
jgi:biopolymer transport protein ExbD